MAASQGFFAVAKLLLTRGADPNIKAGSHIPLYAALATRYDEIAVEIARHMPNIHGSVFWASNHFPPLHAASYWASPRCTRYLLERGARVDELNDRRHTLLWAALKCPRYASDTGWRKRELNKPDNIL
jgi:ankyrin repeat protein